MPDSHVTLIGNLTDDPEVRFTPNAVQVASFRLAVTPRVKDGDAWRDGDTSFFRVNVWRDLAANVTDSLSKGDRAVVIGRLRMRSWQTPEGEARSVVEVEAEEVAPSLRWAVAKPQRTAAKAGARTAEGPTAGGDFDESPTF
jgi:single-strand DNA-binding protein